MYFGSSGQKPDRSTKSSFEIVNKAWRTLENEDTRRKCMEVFQEARQRTDYVIAKKRKNQEREGRGREVEEVDPIKYKQVLHVMMVKIFANMEIRRSRNKKYRSEETQTRS